MAKIEFLGRLEGRGPAGAWTFLDFPKSTSAQLGTRARVPVVVTINGASIRTSAFPTGDGTHQINVNKAFQRSAGILPGDCVKVSVEIDAKPRTVAVPADLETALARSPKARANFGALAPSQRKAYVDWIREAKRPETRSRRVADAARRLGQGKGRFWD